MQTTACSPTVTAAAAIASLPRGPSNTSAKTPAINVSRNGNAHIQLCDCTPVVTTTTSPAKQSSGVVLPKYC